MYYCLRKLAGILLSWVTSVHALEIPVEEDLSIMSLSNGVQVWLMEHGNPRNAISCRVVARNPLEEWPQIFSFDCPSDFFEEELPYFIEYCRETIKKQTQCDIAVIAVGDFDKAGLQGFCTQALDVFTEPQIVAAAPISIGLADQSDSTELYLYYKAELNELKTDTDIKQLWVLYLLQSMCQERLHKALTEKGAEWISHQEIKHFLPAGQMAAHGKKAGKHDPGTMLVACLAAMHEIKGKGFAKSELSNAKAKLHKNLMSFYHQNPDSNLLADYYSSHFALDKGSPSYNVFMSSSLNLVSAITMKDIAVSLRQYFRDDSRRVELKLPKDATFSEAEVAKALDESKTDMLRWEVAEDEDPIVENNNDLYLQLPITEAEAQIIYEIVDTMANNNVLTLLTKKSAMEKKGNKIHHVHPIRFLSTVFTNNYLKRCMAEIMDSYFKWDGFMSGISIRLEEESDRNNMLQYVPSFSQAVKANPDQVRLYVQKREWEKLVKYLIKLSN
jgi:hypothetical protein